MKKMLFFLCVCLTLNAFSTWVYDPSAKTITDGSWVLNVYPVNGGLEIGKPSTESSQDGYNVQNQGSGILDLSGFYVDTGLKIVSIKKNALRNNAAMTTFIAPDVVSIGNNALIKMTGLVEITISSDVSNMGTSAFEGCRALVNISPRVFNKITAVPNRLFYECLALDGTLSFPNATSLGSQSFYKTSALDKIIVGSQLKSISSESMRSCGISAFEPEELPNLTLIGSSAFGAAANLKSNFVLPAIKELSGFNGSGIESVTAVNAMSIAGSAFKECANLQFVEFNPALTNIAGNAFNGCGKLKRVTAYIPDTCSSLGNCAFEYCSSLAMPLRIANQKITALSADSFRSTAAAFTGPVEIYSPITSIGDGCFRGSKRGQIYRFYGRKAPTTFSGGVFSFATDVQGVSGNVGVYVQIMKRSAVEGWRAFCSTEYTDEQLATLPGYPGKKAIGVTIRKDGSKNNYSWYVDCSPPIGTSITIL